MAPKARVESGPSIRSASKSKQRPAGSSSKKVAGSDPYGSSSGASLASSLSSLFSPKPHGKDAALASLLASSSRPPTSLGPPAGLQSFGLLSQSSAAKKPKLESGTSAAPTAKEVSSPALTPLQAKETLSKSAKTITPSSSLKDIEANKASTSVPVMAPAKFNEVVIPSVPAGRKPVFRPVLASSTMISWPEMPAAGSHTILHTLLDVLAAPEVQQIVHNDLGRKAKPLSGVDHKSSITSPAGVGGPAVLAGINSITRQIEGEISRAMSSFANPHTDTPHAKAKTEPAKVRIVFVCRNDGSPSSLVAHFPMLTCAYNAVASASSWSDEELLLFPLPAGSESLLAKAVGLRRCAALALTSQFPHDHLRTILTAIASQTGTLGRLKAAWLNTAVRAAASASRSTASAQTQQLSMNPTTIKFLRTTQPVDLNACKSLKKSKRKLRASRWKARKLQFQQHIKRLQRDVKKTSTTASKRKTRLSSSSHTQRL